VISNIAMARLSHNFATMYQAGMSINGIFEILMENVLGNRYLENLLKKAHSMRFNRVIPSPMALKRPAAFPHSCSAPFETAKPPAPWMPVLRTTGHVL
jgi:type II secretory pathway component PulF